MVTHQVLLNEEYYNGKTCSTEIVREGPFSKQEETPGNVEKTPDMVEELVKAEVLCKQLELKEEQSTGLGSTDIRVSHFSKNISNIAAQKLCHFI